METKKNDLLGRCCLRGDEQQINDKDFYVAAALQLQKPWPPHVLRKATGDRSLY